MTSGACSRTSRGSRREGSPRSARQGHRAGRVRRRGRQAPPGGALAEGAALRRRRTAAHPRPRIGFGGPAGRHRARDGRAGRAGRGGRRRAGGRVTLIGPEVAARALERALQHGGDFGEVYAEDRYGFAVGLDDSRVERPQTGSERGASVRVVYGEATYFGHVDGLAEEDLLRVAESVSQAVRAGDSRSPGALRPARAEAVHPITERPEEVDAARKAQILRDCDERARAQGGEVAQVMASYAENRRTVEIFNS